MGVSTLGCNWHVLRLIHLSRKDTSHSLIYLNVPVVRGFLRLMRKCSIPLALKSIARHFYIHFSDSKTVANKTEIGTNPRRSCLNLITIIHIENVSRNIFQALGQVFYLYLSVFLSFDVVQIVKFSLVLFILRWGYSLFGCRAAISERARRDIAECATYSDSYYHNISLSFLILNLHVFEEYLGGMGGRT